MERGTEARTQKRKLQESTARNARKHHRALGAYFRLPKRLTDTDSNTHMWRHGTNLLPRTTHEFIVSSSILSEIAITDTDRSQSERHALLDMAEWDLDEAAAAAYTRQEHRASVYHQNFLLSPNIIRLESRRAATRLFRGMVEGDVTPSIRQDYAMDMLTLGTRASEGFGYFEERSHELQSSRATEYIGLAHELNAIYSIARKASPTLTAFPAFPRGDSGDHLPTQTHDLLVVGTRWGRIEHAMIAEVKTTPRAEHYERYEAVLIGGTVHLHPDNSPDPSYLTELYAKEARGIATADELTVIESISGTVMHTISHGFNATEQCRDPRTCALIEPTV